MTFSQLPLLILVGFSLTAMLTLLSGCEKSLSQEDRPVTSANEQPAAQTASAAQEDTGLEVVTLGSGCFWCTEAFFRELKGVKSAVSGYSGGAVPNPTYKAVCNGTTGHAEVIQVTFDPKVIPFTDILKAFWETHDPTTLNRQGADVGTQYRSAIFYHNEEQKTEATAYKNNSTHQASSKTRSSQRSRPSINFIPPKTITRTISSSIRTSNTASTSSAPNWKNSALNSPTS